jgi:aminodeoxyfutalosine deaminase
MKLHDYIQSMPKVELNVQLHGAMRPSTIGTIADQNDVTENLKLFQTWMRLYTTPEYNKLDEIARTVSGWIQQPDDLKLVIYELATTLHKQNVRYAEISIDPTLYGALNLQPEDFLTVINDGRDRAQRAWGIRLAWVIMSPRDEPRRAEEIARWTTTMAASKAGIVALGLGGRESVQPVGQFERPFKTAEKRETGRVVRAGGDELAEGVRGALETLNANRILDGRGIADNPDILALLVERNVPVVLSLTRALKHGWVKNIVDYPLRALYDAGITVVLSSDMPTFYNSSLVQEYETAVENGLISHEELTEIALNAARASFLPQEDKDALVETMRAEYAKLGELFLQEA